MTPFSLLLHRLESTSGQVRVIKPSPSNSNQARAYCPHHQRDGRRHGRTPSLSAAETADGRVLICCHAGCSALEVVGALGLDLAALYPAARDPVARQVASTWWGVIAPLDEASTQLDHVRAGCAGSLDRLSSAIRQARKSAVSALKTAGARRASGGGA